MDLRSEDVRYSVPGREILKGISLRVSDHAFHTILGPNGCGKTTFLKTAYRVLTPDSGTVYLDERPIRTMKNRESAKSMAVVAQFNNMNFETTVRDVVMLGRTPHLGFMEREREQDFEIVDDALRRVGMYENRDRSYLSLSGGEKQRVVLARAIAQQPKLLLLDEPTNHLDIRYQLDILRLVKSLKINVLAVLHDTHLACKFSDWIYLLKDGKIRYSGKPADVITAEHMKEIFEVDCEILTSEDGQIIIRYL